MWCSEYGGGGGRTGTGLWGNCCFSVWCCNFPHKVRLFVTAIHIARSGVSTWSPLVIAENVCELGSSAKKAAFFDGWVLKFPVSDGPARNWRCSKNFPS